MENTTLKEEFDIFKQHVNSELERFKTKISEDDKKQVNRDFKNPMSWVTSFEDICMIAGVEPDNVGDKHRDTEDEIAYKQLKLIRKVITNDHKFNWDDENEKKWFPRFDMRSSGFGFSGTHYYFWGTNARVAARLCVRTENEAKFFGTVFVKIWEKYMKQ